MNINIPASISGYLLEEIDLKYTKKNKKKSRGNDVSNLKIKYFTNKSSNLHLSSVTKGNEVRKEPYNIAGDKYRRDEYPHSKAGYGGDVERPFMFKQKYPLRLLDKIRSASSRRKKLRRGKNIRFDEDSDNLISEDGAMKIKLEGGSIDDIDLDALDSIVFTSPETTQQFEEETETKETEDLSIPQLYEIFENVGQLEIEDSSEGNDITREGKTHTTTSVNWFGSIIPSLFSALPKSFKSSIFSHSRKRRSTDLYSKYYSTLQKDKNTAYVITEPASRQKTKLSQYLPPSSYEDPRKWFKKNILKIGSIDSLKSGKKPFLLYYIYKLKITNRNGSFGILHKILHSNYGSQNI